MNEVLISLFFLIAMTLGGYACLALLDRRHVLDEAERWTLSFPAGVGWLGAVLYTLNVCGIPFDTPLVIVVLLAGVAVAGWMLGERRQALRDLVSGLRRSPFRPGLMGCISLTVAFLVLVNYIAQAYYYPMCQGDTQIYHFPYAAIVFRTHHQPVFGSTAWTEEFSFPPALFISYAALWALLGHINQLVPHLYPIPLLSSWACLTVLTLRRALRGSDEAACLSLLAFSAIYELNVVVTGECTDLLPVVAGGAAVYLLARDIREGARNRFLMALFFLGVCSWTKYHGVPFAACAAAGWWLTTRQHWKSLDWKALREATWLLVGNLALLSPLLIRNAIHFGNPIYPGAGHLLGGYGTTRWGVDVVGAWWQPAELFHNFSYVLPLMLREAPIVLGFPAVWIFWRRRDRAGSFIGVTAVLFLLVFVSVLSNRTPFPLRFAAPALGLLSWLAGSFLDQLSPTRGREVGREGPRPSVVGAAWCAITVVLVLLDWFLARKNILNNGLNLWDLGKDMPGSIGGMWWIALFGVGLLAAGSTIAERLAERDRRSQAANKKSMASLPGALVALTIGAVALNHHQPFKVIRSDLATGMIQTPRWDIRPRPTPVVTWMQSHIDEHAVTYTFYFSRWAVPGMIVAPDDPLLEEIHRPGTPLRPALEALRRMGVQYVLDWKLPGDLGTYPPYVQDPIFPRLKGSPYFQLLKSDYSSSLYKVRYPGGMSPCRPGPGHPMPWLMEFAATGPVASGQIVNAKAKS